MTHTNVRRIKEGREQNVKHYLLHCIEKKYFKCDFLTRAYSLTTSKAKVILSLFLGQLPNIFNKTFFLAFSCHQFSFFFQIYYVCDEQKKTEKKNLILRISFVLKSFLFIVYANGNFYEKSRSPFLLFLLAGNF